MKRETFFKLPKSRIHSENVQKSEQILGYFVGPCLVYMAHCILGGSYLTQFYTDVLGLSGSILTMMPLFSKLLCAVTSFCIGRLIDRTRTSQGKGRPWILASGVLLTVSGILLYAVPQSSPTIRILWVILSYNLFFDLALAIYSLSHSLMVPLSTRDVKQRDSLSMLTSMGTSMIPGMLATIIMPILIGKIGVGADAQSSWLFLMGLLSVIAIPATLIEYFFTLERVTASAPSCASAAETISFQKQFAACLQDPKWVMIISFTLVLNFCNGLSTNSMLYYCNWVLGDSVESGITNQLLVNMIGQAPMGFGIAILWPLVKKFGKRNVTLAGFTMAAAGSLLILCNPNNMILVLIGLLIRSTGSLPTYVMASFLAEAMDSVEQRSGFRVDGFSASVNSICQTVIGGLAQTLLLGGINTLGYIVPESTAQVITQPVAVQTFFAWCFAGISMLGLLLGAVIMFFYRENDR